jgi:hypothetical protein
MNTINDERVADERDAACARVRYLETKIDELTVKHNAALTHIDKLLVALEEYGQHGSHCYSEIPEKYIAQPYNPWDYCDCGLGTALGKENVF